MTIYVVPEYRTGKDFPTVPNQRFASYAGRGGAIARAISLGYGFVAKHRNILTAGGAIVAGNAIQGINVANESTDRFPETLRAIHRIHGGKRKRNSSRLRGRHAYSRCQHTPRGNRRCCC